MNSGQSFWERIQREAQMESLRQPLLDKHNDDVEEVELESPSSSDKVSVGKTIVNALSHLSLFGVQREGSAQERIFADIIQNVKLKMIDFYEANQTKDASKTKSTAVTLSKLADSLASCLNEILKAYNPTTNLALPSQLNELEAYYLISLKSAEQNAGPNTSAIQIVSDKFSQIIDCARKNRNIERNHESLIMQQFSICEHYGYDKSIVYYPNLNEHKNTLI